MHNRYLIAACAASLASPSFATEQLATVVVTATRQETRVNEVIADVTVIEREAIEQAAQSTLLELLGRQPGLEFSANGGPGMASDLRIRGSESKHVLVLVDGLRVSSATLGTISWSRMPLSQIERIEILRGPASSLYGSDALGGVVQIFTRRGDGPLKLSADIGTGSYGTNATAVGLSGGQNGWRYALGLAEFRTAGFSAIVNKASKAYNPDRDGYRLSSMDGSVSYAPTAGHELGVSFLSNKGRNSYDSGFSAAGAAKEYQSQTDVGAAKVFLKSQLTQRWHSTLTYGRSEDNATNYTNRAVATVFRTIQDQWSWQNDVRLPVGKALLAVESLRQDIGGTSAYTLSSRTINSLLGGWHGNIGAHSLQLNLRRDRNSQFGARNTGNAAYGYQLAPQWRAHGAYGTAFRAPSFNDLYFPNTPGVGVGNPALLPESSRNAEIGLRFETPTRQASLLYFKNRIENLIQWVETPPGSFFYAPVNVASARIDGWNGSYQARTGAWTTGANLNLQNPVDASSGRQLNRRARNFGALNLGRDNGAWTAGAELQAVGSRWDDVANTVRLGGYALVNLYASYAVDKDWSVYGRINNLFDRNYETARDFGVSGTNLFVGLRYAPR